MSQDYQDVESVGIQISDDGQKLWLCINGACTLRIKGIQRPIDINDTRPESKQKE